MAPESFDQTLRAHVLELLDGGAAHLDFEAALADLPPHLRGVRPNGLPYSPWQLLEHLRICQWDILQFCNDPNHVSPDFPDGYWPDSDAPPDDHTWDQSLDSFRRDFQAMRSLIANPETNLLTPIPGGDGQTIAREAMLLADHNAYHLGQFVILRRLLGAWPEAT